MTNGTQPRVAEAAQNLSQKSTQLASEAGAWISGNAVDILIAAAIGSVIALLLIGLRAFGHRLIRDRGEDGINWRTVVGRVLSKTTLFFVVMCAAGLVAEHAETPPTLLRAIHFLFVIAAAFQAAIWARELILGHCSASRSGTGMSGLSRRSTTSGTSQCGGRWTRWDGRARAAV